MRSVIRVVAPFLFVFAVAACSSAAAGDPSPVPSTGPSSTGGSAEVSIVAKDIAFTTKQVEVPAGTELTMDFDNRDGAPHNVAIYTDSSASASVYVGEIFGGPAVKTFTVPALAAGTYFFRCDVHPDMTGTLVAR